MEKLRSMGSNLLSSATSNKLSKAFKFDGNKSVLGGKSESAGSGNPFLDGPRMEEPSLSKKDVWIHCASLFLSFLGIATTGAVAGFQAKWLKVSGGVGFTLFLLLLAFFIQTALLAIPLIYDRWDRLKRPAQFIGQPRCAFIIHAFGTVLLLLAAMIQTISTWTAPGCKDPANDPHADLGEAYQQGLGQWCTTRKASAIFDWLSFGCWLVLFMLAAIAFRRERKRESGFTPPSNDQGISYANYAQDEERQPVYGEKMARFEEAPTRAHQEPDPYAASAAQQQVYQVPTFQAPAYDEHAYSAVGSSHAGRASADLYGEKRMSRTMQMAQAPRAPQQPSHFDPYAQIRDSLMQPSSGGGGYSYAQNQGLYQSGGAQPPAYGYRH